MSSLSFHQQSGFPRGCETPEVEKTFKVQIRSARGENKAFRSLSIKGLPEDVERARQAIDQRLHGLEGVPGGPAEPTRVITVPADFLSILIGHHGDQVHKLERAAGQHAKLHVWSPGTAAASERSQLERKPLMGIQLE